MHTLFSEIFRMSLSGTGIILLVLLARLALRRAPKIFSYFLWSVVLLRLLCPVGIPVAGLPGPDLRDLRITETAAEPWESPAESREAAAANAVPETVDVPAENGKAALDPLPWFWAAGALGMLFYGIWTYVRFRLSLVGAVRIRGNIYRADHVGAAYVVGLLKPSIYVDSGIPTDQLPYILVHEKIHIRRRDPLTRCLGYGALCLHWFNPLVWLAFVLSGRDMEMSCDEAVVSRLGPQVREPYSRSLLLLAGGRHPALVCPVAFGEGSTKGRILNLARWKPRGKGMKRVCLFLCGVVALVCICEPKAMAAEPVTGSFLSRDGITEFTWNLDTVPEMKPMPVAAVRRHMLTEADVQTVVKAFYGENPVYDLGTRGERQYSRQEIRRKAAFLESYTPESLGPELGLPDDNDAQPENLLPELQAYERLLLQAPEAIPHSLWDGTLEQKPWENDWHNVLKVFGYVNEVPYVTTAALDTYRDRVWNGISIRFGDGGEPEMAFYLAEAALLTGGKPDAAQARAAARDAQRRLEKLAPGSWQVREAQIRDYFWTEAQDYDILVEASQLVAGAPVLQSQYSAYGDLPENAWELPGMTAAYAPEGLLMNFSLGSLLETEAILDPAAKPLPMAELQRAAEQALGSLKGYRMAAPVLHLDWPPEEIRVKAEITELKTGLGLEQRNGDCLAVPAAQLWGTIEYYHGEEKLLDAPPQTELLLTLNALDGTVIG